MKWLAANWFKLGMLVVVLGLAGVIAYYYLVYIPKENQISSTTQFMNAAVARNDLQTCITQAKVNQTDGWSADCNAKGLEAGCSLPEWNASRWDTYLQDQENLCIKEYPQ